MLFAVAHGLAQFQVAAGGQVELHETGVGVYGQLVAVLHFAKLGLIQVGEQAAERAHARAVLGQAQFRKRRRVELVLHDAAARLAVEILRGPFSDCAQQALPRKAEHLVRQFPAVYQLRRRELADLIDDVLFNRAADFRCIDVACRNIGEYDGGGIVRKIHAGYIVVLRLVQKLGVDHGAGRDDAHDLAPDKAFGLRRVLRLLADGDFIPLCDQTVDIRFAAVVRHAAHGGALVLPAVPGGQGQVQLTGRELRVLEKHFVKVAQPVKDDTVPVFFLDLAVLRHHRAHSLRFRHLFYSLIVLYVCFPSVAAGTGGAAA